MLEEGILIPIELYILKPGETDISGTEAKDWSSSPSEVDYFHFDFADRRQRNTQTFMRTNSVNQLQFGVGLRQIERLLVYRDAFIGNLNDADGHKIEQALDYAWIEWPKISGKFSTIYRKTVGGSEYTGTYVWNYPDSGFIAFTGFILQYELYEDHVNNVRVDMLTLAQVTS